MTLTEPKATPTVWRWYVAYCLAMALLYFLVVIAGVALLAFPVSTREYSAVEVKIQAILLAGVGIALFVPFMAAPFLPKKSWAWIYGIVMIAIGMTSMCCLPATIPLLIFWIKPETKEFFSPKPTMNGY